LDHVLETFFNCVQFGYWANFNRGLFGGWGCFGVGLFGSWGDFNGGLLGNWVFLGDFVLLWDFGWWNGVIWDFMIFG
jgi:hypothetical protein